MPFNALQQYDRGAGSARVRIKRRGQLGSDRVREGQIGSGRVRRFRGAGIEHACNTIALLIRRETVARRHTSASDDPLLATADADALAAAALVAAALVAAARIAAALAAVAAVAALAAAALAAATAPARHSGSIGALKGSLHG